MTTTITATVFKNLINKTTTTTTDADYISDTNAERCIDQGIDLLNTFLRAATLSNLTGTAGSKTGSYASNQAGAILAMATQVYIQSYRSAGAAATSSSLGLGPYSTSESSSSSTGGKADALLGYAQTLAEQLRSFTIVRT